MVTAGVPLDVVASAASALESVAVSGISAGASSADDSVFTAFVLPFAFVLAFAGAASDPVATAGSASESVAFTGSSPEDGTSAGVSFESVIVTKSASYTLAKKFPSENRFIRVP